MSADTLTVARHLRVVFESRIAKTWDTFAMPNQITAYQFAQLVIEQTGCSLREAAEVTREVCPSLLAEWWEALPQNDS